MGRGFVPDFLRLATSSRSDRAGVPLCFGVEIFSAACRARRPWRGRRSGSEVCEIAREGRDRRAFRSADYRIQPRFDRRPRDQRGLLVEVALKRDLVPIVSPQLARRSLGSGYQAEQIFPNSPALLRRQHGINAETAEVGDLTGKQFRMQHFRHESGGYRAIVERSRSLSDSCPSELPPAYSRRLFEGVRLPLLSDFLAFPILSSICASVRWLLNWSKLKAESTCAAFAPYRSLKRWMTTSV